ncbi:hypothetical protein B0H65DRAFT_478993 [Neurospora tetraspora]|uniref:Secreted protein n=1 Tax=Neurospora tetraspora TaxID=94610 RepID=A0AAE0MMZ9_9PEZI|nr:hypothetical protein B0H65DRAFT_478993 [Neurospora tetraspora]
MACSRGRARSQTFLHTRCQSLLLFLYYALMAWSADKQIRGAAGESLDGYGENGGVKWKSEQENGHRPHDKACVGVKMAKGICEIVLEFGASSWRQSWGKRCCAASIWPFCLFVHRSTQARHAGWLGMAWNLLTLPETGSSRQTEWRRGGLLTLHKKGQAPRHTSRLLSGAKPASCQKTFCVSCLEETLRIRPIRERAWGR